jgi:hypothetical protein
MLVDKNRSQLHQLKSWEKVIHTDRHVGRVVAFTTSSLAQTIAWQT